MAFGDAFTSLLFFNIHLLFCSAYKSTFSGDAVFGTKVLLAVLSPYRGAPFPKSQSLTSTLRCLFNVNFTCCQVSGFANNPCHEVSSLTGLRSRPKFINASRAVLNPRSLSGTAISSVQASFCFCVFAVMSRSYLLSSGLSLSLLKAS